MQDKVNLTLLRPERDTASGKASTSIPRGMTFEELFGAFITLPSPPVAAKVNNEILPLQATLEINATVTPVLLESSEGAAIYRCSLAFLLAVAARELFPERSLYIGHSLGRSYYYTFREGKKPGSEEIESLEQKMRSLVQKDLPITRRPMAFNEALEVFKTNRQEDTALLLRQKSEPQVIVNECAGFIDLYLSPIVNRTGLLQTFNLMQYEDGFLLRFPPSGNAKHLDPFEDSPKIFSVYAEYKKWGRIIGVHSAGNLNRLIGENNIREYIHIAEAFQEKKIGEIADNIYRKKENIKTILIAGPSSSGKTTSAKRLSIALKVLGIEPIAISLDDYYVGTDKTPKDENGAPDYECLEALDVPYLNQQLLALLEGEEVTLPVFDFKAGRRREEGGRKIRLRRRTMLIIEGIHGLNDALTPQISSDTKYKLYVSALTQLNLDDHNRIPTSDNRLLRRIVRDNQFRGATATRTLNMWPSVQRGERKHIFPFQNSADTALNTALDYELPVLKYYADPLLRTVKPNQSEYPEAARLLAFLSNFAPIPPGLVPGTSILREFIGDSEFEY